MADDAQKVAQLIRSGAYFREAKAWYQTIYVRPIGERSFFLVVGVLAALIAVCGFIAFVHLLPIKARPPILVATEAIDETIPSLTRLRAQSEPIDPAMLRFFLKAYVLQRESYAANRAEAAQAFVIAHTDARIAGSYTAAIAPENPQSPVNVLGQGGQRQIDITGVTWNTMETPPSAVVTYFVYDWINGQSSSKKAQATLRYDYAPLKVKEVVDKASGQIIIQTEEPQFQVVQYETQSLQ